jgi:hypothetical protein
VEALKFVSWPGELVIPEGTLWAESEEIRKAVFAKGRSESTDWQTLAAKLAHTDEYEISHASLAASEGNHTTLKIDLLDYDQNDFPEVRITAERVQFFLGLERELTHPSSLTLENLIGERLRSAAMLLL